MAKIFIHKGGFLLTSGLFLALTFFSCNTQKRLAKKENKAVALVKNSNSAADKLKGFFFEKYPCANDTITKVIEGKEVIKYDTSTVYIDGERVFINDTLYIERIKVITKEVVKTRTDTIHKSIVDNRLVNLWKDSSKFHKYRSEIFESNEKVLRANLSLSEKHVKKWKLYFWGGWILFIALIILYNLVLKKLNNR